MEPAHGIYGAYPNAFLPQIVERLLSDWQVFARYLQLGVVALYSVLQKHCHESRPTAVPTPSFQPQ